MANTPLPAAEQTAKLVLDLQKIAYEAGHPVPLAIGLDQENGGVNSLFDERYIGQFPSAMGVAATGSTEMAYQIANATAEELSSVGVNWIMGPVLDVLTNVKNQPLGVRTTGDDPEEVSRYGVSFMKGYKDAGLATCGKHFPSYGNLEFLGSSLDVPIIRDSLEQLSLSALVPFRDAITKGVDAMMVGGCAMSSAGVNVMHACLSEQVVDELLREDLGFDGVVVSECLEMEALSHNIGVGGGTVMAVKAGCDVVLICRSFNFQQEAINGLKQGLENGMITKSRIKQSLRRMLEMKAKCTSWEKALAPGGMEKLTSLQPSHSELSTRAYNTSITVVRDKVGLLPLSKLLDSEEELLLLSPLVKPLAASAAAREMASQPINPSADPANRDKGSPLLSGESIFREFARSLARQRKGRVLHTSYTAHGVRPMHENLINRASAVIVITADAHLNLYQHGFVKHVALICKLSPQAVEQSEKPLVIVSVSSPYDFAMDTSIGTYICTYDSTETALRALVDVLLGILSPTGSLPGTINPNQKPPQSSSKQQQWLVERWDEERDADALDDLLKNLQLEGPIHHRSEVSGCSSETFLVRNEMIEETHFVVRNSSTKALYGFCSSYFFKATTTGVIGAILVDPARRKLGVGQSLHTRAIESLRTKEGIKRFQLGSRLPSVFLGIPSSNNFERIRLRQWFANMGWNITQSRPVCSMILKNLGEWKAPENIVQSVHRADLEFDLVHGMEHSAGILDHIKTSSRQGVMEIYTFALKEPKSCGVIQAKRKGVVLGTVVIYDRAATWAKYVPAAHDRAEVRGGISSPVISPSVGEYSTLLRGLILLGIHYIQKQQAQTVLLDCVSRSFLENRRYCPQADNVFFSSMAMAILIAYPRLVSVRCTVLMRSPVMPI